MGGLNFSDLAVKVGSATLKALQGRELTLKNIREVLNGVTAAAKQEHETGDKEQGAGRLGDGRERLAHVREPDGIA